MVWGYQHGWIPYRKNKKQASVVDEVTAVDDMNKDGTDVDDLYADDVLQYLVS